MFFKIIWLLSKPSSACFTGDMYDTQLLLNKAEDS